MDETTIQKMLSVIPKDKVSLIKSLNDIEYQDDDYQKFWDDLRDILIREIGDDRTEYWQQRVHHIYHWYIKKDVMSRMK
jgi:hypothetical protein